MPSTLSRSAMAESAAASTSFFGWRRRGMLPQYNNLLR